MLIIKTSEISIKRKYLDGSVFSRIRLRQITGQWIVGVEEIGIKTQLKQKVVESQLQWDRALRE